MNEPLKENISTGELDGLLTAMILSAEGISDLLFVTGKAPQIEVHGRLQSFKPEPVLASDRIESLARAIINGNPRLLQDMADHGSCDCSYSLSNLCRFRVNIYRQNGNYAMVLRRLQSQIPSLESLKLAPVFREIIKEKTGLVFVTGGTGSGKTTTLAAMLNEINLTSEVHVVTLEDPVEFLHPQLKATFSQRELGRDFFSFPEGLRAALRQAPKIIFVGEIRDRETMEHAIAFAETGHLCLATMHANSSNQALDRIINFFPEERREQLLMDLSLNIRALISQRLIPRESGSGRIAAMEIMLASPLISDLIFKGEVAKIKDVMARSNRLGMKTFDQALFELYEAGLISYEDALRNADSKNELRLKVKLESKREVKGGEEASSALQIVEEEEGQVF